MRTKIIKISSVLLLSVFIIFALIMGCADYLVPSRQSYYEGQPLMRNAFVKVECDGSAPAIATTEHVRTVNATAKLFGILPLKEVSVDYYDKFSLYVGGFPFGVKFFTEGIIVVNLADVSTDSGSINPAYDAGIRANDIIIKCNGTAVASAKELTSMIENSGGKALTLTYKRDGAEFNVSLTPVLSKDDGLYKTGMWIKDSGAGIGTVTYVSPEDYSFGGLGHGICDPNTGELLPMQRGSLMDVTLSGVKKGLVGDPGEIKGYFDGEKLGAVLTNTDCGVFGIYAEKPKEANRLFPIGLKNEIQNGKATVICTLDESGAKEYEIELSAINESAPINSNKCFTVKVTDPKLIDITGGIVQGMSGSPIIQNGKIIGAITHVMINDPTTGYGIFIENMLNQMGETAN
ncbi:MAG: SpoIVB peptidase [Clostridia bacterium]|nr:SpoIVB peptidase [Clostridia bacterium]